MSTRMIESISFRMDTRTREALQAEAQKRGVPVATLVRQALLTVTETADRKEAA